MKEFKNIDFETSEGRFDFIQNNESSIYEGTNKDGERVIITLEKGIGMDVKTQKHSKPKWFEVVEYDADGWQVGVTYEPV